MKRPPVSVVPAIEESIPSMLWRLQRQTGLPTNSLRLKGFRKLYDDPDPAVLAFLGGILGVDVETLAAHTLEGRLPESYASLAWRDHRMPRRLGCQDCGHQTVWSRLVLVSACPACGALLNEDNTSRGPAPEPARALQSAYLDALISNRLADDERIERIWRLLSFHLCTGWPTGTSSPRPMPVGTGLGKPRDLPWRNPEWIAQFATLAWPATETTKTFREHIKRVTVSRLRGGSGGAAGSVRFDEATGEGHEDVTGEREVFHRQIRRWRLEERNIPDHLLEDYSPLDGCHLEAIGYAASRALRREVVLAHSGHRPTKEELIAGRGPLRQTREIAAINQLLAHDAAGIQILRRHAARLAETDPGDRADYEERRATLATSRGVPTSVLRKLNPALRDRRVASRVRANPLARDAAAWIWIELAGGVLHHSPHHAAARARLRAFDRSLTPEDRLVLLEHGYEVLGAVADDVARQHRPGIQTSSKERRTDVG